MLNPDSIHTVHLLHFPSPSCLPSYQYFDFHRHHCPQSIKHKKDIFNTFPTYDIILCIVSKNPSPRIKQVNSLLFIEKV